MSYKVSVIAGVIGLITVFGLVHFGVPGPVFADEPDARPDKGKRPSGEAIYVEAPLIEADSYEEARAKHHQRERERASGDVTSMDERSGDCGKSWMWLSMEGELMARFDFGATTFRSVQMVEEDWKWDLYKFQWPFWVFKTDRARTDHVVAYTWSEIEYQGVGSWGAGDYKGVLKHLRIVHGDGVVCWGLEPEDTAWID